MNIDMQKHREVRPGWRQISRRDAAQSGLEQAMAVAKQLGAGGEGYLTYQHQFGLPTITDTTKKVCPNPLDLGEAKVHFGGKGKLLWMAWKTVITGDAGPLTVLLEFCAGDAVDGDVNDDQTNLNEVLGCSGIVRRHPRTGAAIVTGDTIYGAFPIRPQTSARRFYFVNTTLGGTAPDIVEGTSFANIVETDQANQYY